VEGLAIERVGTAILDVPLVRPHRFARTGMDAQPILLVTVTTRGGAVGVGEGVVAWFRRN
jgi:muconate cycloisomerase